MPFALSMSPSPSESGTSGPQITKSNPFSSANFARTETSSAGIGATSQSRSMPPLPGAHTSLSSMGERFAAKTSACSRPPLPTINTFNFLPDAILNNFSVKRKGKE